MSYAQFSTILASDYNTFVGTNPNSTANTLNTVWATGSNISGYGQTPVATVAVNTTILAPQWANLINTTKNCANHQGSTITAVTAPSAGNTIAYISAIPTNLQTIYTNRANAVSQGTTSANTTTRATTWTSAITFTFTATFANGDAARYFFNSGGQLKFTFSQPTGTALANSYNTLATACGTIAISAPGASAPTTANIVGTIYNGVTKVGGSGSTNALSTTSGYYGLTTSNVTLFKQLPASTPAGYANSSISIIGKTSTANISGNLDNGNVLTLYAVWQEATSTGATVTAGGATTLTAVYPETSNISNTWGTVTLAGSVAGS
jgi:hypothetical protein